MTDPSICLLTALTVDFYTFACGAPETHLLPGCSSSAETFLGQIHVGFLPRGQKKPKVVELKTQLTWSLSRALSAQRHYINTNTLGNDIIQMQLLLQPCANKGNKSVMHLFVQALLKQETGRGREEKKS